jgi:hypothetical protein
MDVQAIKLEIIKAGEKAVKQLIKVAEEDIISESNKKENLDSLSADKLKNAAATKKLAIFDAFEILNKIEAEKNAIEGVNKEEKKPTQGFAERRST